MTTRIQSDELKQKTRESLSIYKGYVTSKCILGITATVTAVGLLAIFGGNIPSICHLGFLKDFSNMAHAHLSNTSLIGITSGTGALGAITLTNMIITKYFRKTKFERGRLHSKIIGEIFNYKLPFQIENHIVHLTPKQKKKLLKKVESLEISIKDNLTLEQFNKLKEILKKSKIKINDPNLDELIKIYLQVLILLDQVKKKCQPINLA